MSNIQHGINAVIKQWSHNISYIGGEENLCWTCQVYTAQHTEFLAWMNLHCPHAKCIYRFNSGNPAITVDINDEAEASVFKLSWNMQ